MDAELLARLRALGGDVSGEVSPWGSYEVYAPLGAASSIAWYTPAALEQEVADWEQQGISGMGLRVALLRIVRERDHTR